MKFPKVKLLPKNNYLKAVIIIAVIALVWFYWNDITYFGKKVIGKNPADDNDDDLVLSKGSSGGEVRQLQSLLNGAGADPKLIVDGRFGKKTEAALEELTGEKETTINEFKATLEAVAAGAATTKEIAENMQMIHS